MTEMLKHLGGELRRYYDAIVQRPMPWRMIDKLATLEEADERRGDRGSFEHQAEDGGFRESLEDRIRRR
ncbi:hypothetical protein [Hyphomicrobium sp. DMF-1]|jgi:hypothetical protein|uniref:hypothetical protein n=1 Tax=Hyphomicrobium sp. DMF-1 TaxID=3019544 RepID=UPI0022EC0388|nr:hypothetical protein [Hyphomicrobium sp. DMF-1]WBT39726.1 hypothetical protein PE058_07555 [Hyphomicrobium sp. DMF-1]